MGMSIDSGSPVVPQPGSRRKQGLYLLLLALGTLLPYAQSIPWLAKHGLDVARFREELFATRVSSFFAWDLLIAVPTLIALVLADRELSVAQRWLVAVASLFGASVGLPLYLALREQNRLRMSSAD